MYNIYCPTMPLAVRSYHFVSRTSVGRLRQAIAVQLFNDRLKSTRLETRPSQIYHSVARVPKGGSLEPWSPEIYALEPGARSPTILLTGALVLFWLWSLEPKNILHGARSPAFSSLIIRVPDCIDS